MCGIIGYIGFRKASEVILQGLKTLEYRGYDSAGIAVSNEKGIEIKKGKGKVVDVSNSLCFTSLKGKIGIGHTRWGTHGNICNKNAHPHFDCPKELALVHNGVIENYIALKKELITKGHKFRSETDSEVIIHLVEQNRKSMQLENAFVNAVKRLRGSYAIVLLAKDEQKIFAARKNSPLILGIGKSEHFLTSDIPAVLPYTRKIVTIEDEHIAIISKSEFKIFDFRGNKIKPKIIKVNWTQEIAEKGGFAHFMLKEIYEQKTVLRESSPANILSAKKMIANTKNIDIIACGTSNHAGIIFSILLEKYLKKNARTFIASEYQAIANPNKNVLVIAISQSGETADTLQAVRFAKSKNAKILALTNVIGSSLARISNKTVYLNAGPEIGVAATKTFLFQLAVIYRLIFENYKNHENRDVGDVCDVQKAIPKLIESTLSCEQKIQKIKSVALKLKDKNDIFFIGRGLCYPIAMEGALKLKELSYLHAEAYPAGELKHGPLSLIQPNVPVIVLAPSDQLLPKIHGNIKEVKARGAFVIALTDNAIISKEADIALKIKKTKEILYPFSMLPILQLLAYYISVLRGTDPDHPRNLAKSVTVE
ncbi:MAG: glutamine--fructose-6-phosphate transaminase (isomerizing) [Candidatus Micrarchaeota archaeon]